MVPPLASAIALRGLAARLVHLKQCSGSLETCERAAVKDALIQVFWDQAKLDGVKPCRSPA